MKKIVCLILTFVLLSGYIPSITAVGNVFTDVPADSWYASAVEYCYENSLMEGVSETSFAPDRNMNRAMVVMVLYRLGESPDVAAANPFEDVPDGTWYTDAVVWAVENNITTGISSTKFAPNDNVTREQLVTFLYRYAHVGWNDPSISNCDNLNDYQDAQEVSGFARVPLSWAVASGIISGTDATHLSPKGLANRAQCAVILTRFDRWLAGEPVAPEMPEPEPSEPEETTPAPDEEADEQILAEMNSRPGMVGRLTIPSVGVDVALFAESIFADSQAIVDAKDSAAYLDTSGASFFENLGDHLIADHRNQGFSALNDAVPGETIATINFGTYSHDYVCIDKTSGKNTGTKLVDENGNHFTIENEDGICMYTCRNNGITVTFWVKVTSG